MVAPSQTQGTTPGALTAPERPSGASQRSFLAGPAFWRVPGNPSMATAADCGSDLGGFFLPGRRLDWFFFIFCLRGAQALFFKSSFSLLTDRYPLFRGISVRFQILVSSVAFSVSVKTSRNFYLIVWVSLSPWWCLLGVWWVSFAHPSHGWFLLSPFSLCGFSPK